jgi:hypothetical protein
VYPDRTPGVRFEWLDPPRAATTRRTDIAGFVGIAARGPLHQPRRVESWTQFTTTFGGHIPQGYLAYAVEGFFANGGRTCWVVRAADPATAAPATLELLGSLGLPVLRLGAVSPGTWGRDVVVTLARTGEDRFSLTVQTSDGSVELWRNLTMDTGDERYVVTLLNDETTGSRLIRTEDLALPGALPAVTPSERAANLRDGAARLAGGSDGLAALRPEHLTGEHAPPDKTWGLAALEPIDEVAIVAVPDLMAKPRQEPRRRSPRPRCDLVDAPPPPPPADETPVEFPPVLDEVAVAAVQAAVVRHCERLQDRVAVLDPRGEDGTPTLVSAWRRQFDTSYAALYWPWLRCPDPLRLDGLLRPVPPSGHVAGVYARGDLEVGVHKPPANEPLEACSDVVTPSDDSTHGDLNHEGVNVIRAWNGLGIRVAGARTLATDPLVRYVNVRRLLNMIEEAIVEDSQFAVFEPNGPALWREVERVVRALLDLLWRQGALDGATADEAYTVTCDATTNTPEETDAGRLICLVGLQPPWPAEFVIVRIGRSEGSAEIAETGRGAGG